MRYDDAAMIDFVGSILRPVQAHREASRLEQASQPELRARTQLMLEHAVGLRLAVQVRDEDRAAGYAKRRKPAGNVVPLRRNVS